ncbi:MAG TPA: 3-phosphoshikimate 1-carboxyvinyltransferase [Polyangiales bacterium]|nr:3-phosphoshikimate 1-carboxyvinyltransferase [Polyangiales bacterium]
MTEARAIVPLTRPVDADVPVVGSKSYTNRALIIAALAEGESLLTGALFSDDTQHMAEALRQLGIPVDADFEARTLRVQGAGGKVPAASAKCFVGNSGTTARFLSVVLALGDGVYEIDGVPRMRERPNQPLIDALTQLGVRIEALAKPGCFPLRIHGGSLQGGAVSVAGSASSQYASGLMMAAPAMPRGLALELTGSLVSKPYLEMTAQTMRDFGAKLEWRGEREFVIAAGPYLGRTYAIEPDASAASYFFAAAAITGGRVRVNDLGTRSLQGDRGLVHLLERMGCKLEETASYTELRGPADGKLRGIDVDMSELSDVAQTLAVVAPFASTPTRVTGIGFIRHKETDRVAAVVNELQRLGIRAEEEEDGYLIYPGTPHSAQIETYDDHRMAMSFALVGLRVPGVEIKDPGCVSKTFPTYFDVLETLRK